MLFAMRPSLSLCYAPGVDIGDRKASADFFITNAGIGKRTNLTHGISGKLGHAVGFAVMGNISMSTFLNHIACIVSGSTKPQMIWIHATGIVAGMANEQIIADGTFVDFIRNTMGAKQDAIASELSIAAIVDITLPLPTIVIVACRHMFPKALFWGVILASMTVAKSCMLTFYSAIGCACDLGDRCGFPATTLAKPWLRLRRNKIAGILGHVETSLQVLNLQPGV